MSVSALDEPEFNRWRRTAASSLETARSLRGLGVHHHACLHAEQAAQQALKGLLHGVGSGDRARGHNVSGLGAAAAEASGAELHATVTAALGRLTRHYLPSRYPDALADGAPEDHYSEEDAAQAVTDAEVVLALVDASWKDLLAAAEEAGEGGRP